jgi:nucleotide-binding universal stress UspA family protein
MYKTIVVGTDGSPRAAHAVEAAQSLAALTGATLHVVCAYQPVALALASVAGAAGSAIPVDLGDEQASARTIADDAARKARESGIAVETHAVARSAADALCDVAEACDADLIVVGNRGMSGRGRVLGSVPNTVTHHARCAVLVVATDA